MERAHTYIILLGNILDLVFCYLNIIQIHLQVISYKIVRIIVHDYSKLLTPSNIVPKHHTNTRMVIHLGFEPRPGSYYYLTLW